MCYTLDEVRARVSAAAEGYNSAATDDERLERVSLFGSYAGGTADDDSDVDLLVTFQSPVVSLLTLARVLEAMERALDLSVDLVQDPLPDDALLEIRRKVSLYEAA
mgnify:FL=1